MRLERVLAIAAAARRAIPRARISGVVDDRRTNRPKRR